MSIESPVNDEVVHAVPGPRRLRDGDLVTLDVTAELDGYYADTSVSMPVDVQRPATARLVTAAQAALRRGIDAARVGAPRATRPRSCSPRRPTEHVSR